MQRVWEIKECFGMPSFHVLCFGMAAFPVCGTCLWSESPMPQEVEREQPDCSDGPLCGGSSRRADVEHVPCPSHMITVTVIPKVYI